MSDYNEEAYENALIELFQNMGWEHVYGPDIERDWHSPLYDSVLEDSIRRINPTANPAAIDEALLKLRNFENAELKKKNAVFMEYLQNGVEVSTYEEGEQKYYLVKLINYNRHGLNTMEVVDQFTFVEHDKIRCDLVVFVNGMPLVVIELKSPSRDDTDEGDAYLQIKQYQQKCPTLFVYNAFSVISDMLTTKAGTITAKSNGSRMP